jgi:hypothetical protein
MNWRWKSLCHRGEEMEANSRDPLLFTSRHWSTSDPAITFSEPRAHCGGMPFARVDRTDSACENRAPAAQFFGHDLEALLTTRGGNCRFRWCGS